MSVYPVFVVAIIATLWVSSSNGVIVTNLNDECFKCLCHVATRCNLDNQCQDGFCGPYYISYGYWSDGGRVVQPNDDPKRKDAWQDCALDYACAKRIVEGYIQKFGRDCNDDGVTDCFDYVMVNGNGGYGCSAPLNRTESGRVWLERYAECELDD